jgi:hypothetical protein
MFTSFTLGLLMMSKDVDGGQGSFSKTLGSVTWMVSKCEERICRKAPKMAGFLLGENKRAFMTTDGVFRGRNDCKLLINIGITNLLCEKEPGSC